MTTAAPASTRVSTDEFISALFSAARPGSLVAVRVLPPGTEQRLDPHRPGLPDADEFDSGTFWCFGACLRSSRGEPVGGTAVWADLDHIEDGWTHEGLFPTPTAVVSSGGGRHLYWALTMQEDPPAIIRLVHLAKAAFGGDKQTVESKRMMRVPGSFNQKYDPPRQSTVLALDHDARYGYDQLQEDLFVAVILAHAWSPGNRHGAALGVGAILARAEWDEARVERVIRSLCEQGGGDLRDALNAAVGSVRKHESGSAISAQYLREAVGDVWKDVIDGLGITARDGDVELDGLRVGNVLTIERDLISFIVQSGDWGWDEGTLSRWDGKCWNAGTHPDVLASYVFDIMARLKVVVNGSTVEFQAKPRMAKDVAGIASGTLSMAALPPEAADSIAMANGVVNVNTGDTVGYDRKFNHRWYLPFNYDPGLPEPVVWNQFLDFAAPEFKDFLQEWFGYLLTPGNPWQRMLWLYGPSGTGKSTILKVASWMMGLDPSQAKKGAAIAINADNFREYSLAALHNKRVATCSEISRKMMKTAVIKAVVGGDPIEARHPYGRIFSLVYNGVVMFGSNSLPPVDEGEGMWRRMVILELTKVPTKVDEQLDDKLRLEMPQIFNWALAGHRRMEKYYLGEEWPIPSSAKALVGEYREAADIFKRFAEEELVLLRDYDRKVTDEVEEEYQVTSAELYNRYVAWTKEVGAQQEQLGPKFWNEMRKLGMEPTTSPIRRKGRLVRVWKGAKLVAEEVSFR